MDPNLLVQLVDNGGVTIPTEVMTQVAKLMRQSTPHLIAGGSWTPCGFDRNGACQGPRNPPCLMAEEGRCGYRRDHDQDRP
jgi:hypothetical protein